MKIGALKIVVAGEIWIAIWMRDDWDQEVRRSRELSGS